MEAALAQQDDTLEQDTTTQLVGFHIGKELFGVNILKVQEIIRDTTITAIPDAPAFIEGVINLRGNIIPVIDLRKRLKMMRGDARKDRPWILILDIDGRVTGFMVDTVTEVTKVPRDAIKPPPEIVLVGLKSQYISGVCKTERGLLILLDFNRVLMVEEIKKLKALQRE